MSTNKLIPELRFPEFVDEGEWDEKKLNYYLELLTDFEANGSFADVKINVNVYNEPNYAWYVRATDLENNSTIEKIKFVDKKSYEFLRKTSLFGGELLITKRGEIGKVYFFNSENEMPATVAPNLYLLKMNKYAIPKFFYFYFSTSSGNDSLKRLNASSTIGALYKDDIKNISIVSPSLKEQQKIASCLSSLDDLIVAENQKLDTLKDHKKSLMQNLFPQEGETLPKWRFPEFTEEGDWVEKKLDDISIKIQDGTHFSPKAFDKGDYLYITSKNVKNGYMDLSTAQFISKEDHTIIYKRCDVKQGDVLLTKDGTIGQACVNELKIPFSLLSSVAFIRLKKDYSNYFLYHLLVSPIGQTEIESQIAGQALKRITLTKINNFIFYFPPPLEQQKIASCLSSLDELITAKAEKIEQLKLHKKGLMQGLFPKIAD